MWVGVVVVVEFWKETKLRKDSIIGIAALHDLKYTQNIKLHKQTLGHY